MTKAAISCSSSKSKGQVILEYALLALCLCVIALRATLTESPTGRSTAMPANLNDSIYSLSMSTVLISSFVVWFITGFCRKRFSFRFTGIEVGLCIFCIAAFVAGFAAANKRAAITNFATLMAPILMAVLLVQILDSQAKIKLVLICIAALGVVSAYECSYQFLFTNQATIEQYEQDPEAVLGPLGLEPGTLTHFLFEHRLYTKGVRGFFTTSNSAASFSLMAFFAAIALFIEKLKNRKHYWLWSLWLVTSGIAVVIVFWGFVITRSKGAIVGLVFAVAIFIALISFGSWIRAHRKAILLVCLLLFVAGGCVVIRYGLSHGRLPGGNSMLVRWQYWSGATKMYADHPITGVGGGNFGGSYPHYKAPSALESVADPHNFLLSILTQYGSLGLLGFLVMIFMPLWKSIDPTALNSQPKACNYLLSFVIPAVIYLIAVSVILRVARPMISPVPLVGSPEEQKGALILLYGVPVRIFIAGFFLFAAGWKLVKTPATNIPSSTLFCAVLGVALHNLIDFAIFEPGVFTTFWVIIACLIALDSQQKPERHFVCRPAIFTKFLVAAGGVVIIWAYLNYALVPVARASENIKLAMQGIGYTHEYLDQAAKDDRLDPLAPNLNGRFYLQEYNNTAKKQTVLLEKAAKCFLTAIERNHADFKNYEKLSQVYNLLGDTQEAYNRGFEAAKRYPGSGRLQFKLGEIAEKLGKSAVAVEHYREAIEIEDEYRSQFKEMYPGREIVSRLGEEKYKRAKQRIKFLSQQSAL